MALSPKRGRAGRATPVGTATRERALRVAVEGLRGEVRFQAPLKALTSFRIGGPADVLVVPTDLEDLCRLSRQAHAAKLPVFVIGGTNVLIRDRGIRGVVVSLAACRRIQDEGDSTLYAEGGVPMPILLQHALTRSLSGLEWAAGIPGTVAGCVVMNAGTRLGEMKDAVKGVRLVRPSGRVEDLEAASIPFGYRHAKLPAGIVAGVWVQLKPAEQKAVHVKVNEYLRYRKETQPLTLPNAGCAFKNPGPQTAGQVIEAAGLKGYRVGDAQVSAKHANFIVNLGEARADDVAKLIRYVRRTVRRQTGIALELEMKIVGEP